MILAGVKAVALYDPSPVDIKDLGCQFYLTPDDVGKPTAAACKDSLQELNKAVQVGVLESLPNEVLTNYQVCPACLRNFSLRSISALLISIKFQNRGPVWINAVDPAQSATLATAQAFTFKYSEPRSTFTFSSSIFSLQIRSRSQQLHLAAAGQLPSFSIR